MDNRIVLAVITSNTLIDMHAFYPHLHSRRANNCPKIVRQNVILAYDNQLNVGSFEANNKI